MPLIQPFAALRPAPGRAAAVAAPPYDVMSFDEARQGAAGHPDSFIHISRAEVDLPAGTDPYAPAVYAQARASLDRMRAAGVLLRDLAPAYYAYRLTQGAHRQLGLAAGVSLADYAAGRIRRHEFTRPDKEDDRVRQIEALGAQTGPALLAYRATPALDDPLAAVAAAPPAVDFVAPDGVRHELWPIADPQVIAALTAAAEQLDALYIADGHHRLAAAARVAAAQPDNPAAHYGLAVLFPHDRLRILGYHRLLRDLHGLEVRGLLARLEVCFAIEGAPGPVAPEAPGGFGLYLGGHWYRLTLDPERIPHDDPVGRLDASLLQSLVIGPLFGIADPRRDARIDFVGGNRGPEALMARVDTGEMAAAFALHPTRMAELLAVADAGEVMPPKSTWFEPKLADGLVSHVFA